MIQSTPVRAAFVAAYFMEVDLKINQYSNNPLQMAPDVLDGAVTAILFYLGFKGNFQAEKSALEQLRKDWKRKSSEAQDTNLANKAVAEQWEKLTTTDRDGQVTSFNAFMEKIQADINEWKNVIKAEIALKGPVDYWRIKSREHRRRSKYFLKGTTWAFGIVGVFLLLAILPFDDQIEKITLRHIGLIVIVATVGVWAIRLFVKNYLSNVPL